MNTTRIKIQRNIINLAVIMLAFLAIIVLRYAWIQLVEGSELA